MKKSIIALLLAGLLLTGCGAAQRTAPNIPEAQAATASAEGITPGARVPEQRPSASPAAPAGTITREEAEAIALAHAGLTADQVRYLRTAFEIDDGVPQYEVQFHHERWEYDYEIHAETGAVLSFEKSD